MTTACIVQARWASTRLPGKVLERLDGTTVLAEGLTRLGAVPGIAAVCCAVPDGADSDGVAAAAANVAGVRVYRGSEQDVLDRYHGAALMLGAEHVLRVTSDCPLIDPAVCGEVVALYHRTGADYASNNDPPSWPHGLDCEVTSMAWLARAHREARRPSEREHVTPFIRNHPEARRVNLPCPLDGLARHRWTLDHPDDLVFLKAVFGRLPRGPAGWSYRVPLGIVEADPALAAINAGHDRLEGLQKSRRQDRAEGFPEPRP